MTLSIPLFSSRWVAHQHWKRVLQVFVFFNKNDGKQQAESLNFLNKTILFPIKLVKSFIYRYFCIVSTRVRTL